MVEIVGVRALPMVVTIELLPLHPFALVTVTEKVFAVFTVIVWVVAPFDHKYELYPAPAFNTELAPAQMVDEPEIDGVGNAFTIT